MRDDLELCGKEFHRRGFPWGMVTNGLYLTAERFKNLVDDAGLGSVALSLDGLEAEHNWMRCHPQSFEKASEAIDLLARESRIIYDVVTCVNQRNYDQLPQIRDFLIRKGVKAWRLFPIFPVGRAANDPLLQLSNAQYRGLLSFIRQTREEGRIRACYSCEGFLGRYEGAGCSTVLQASPSVVYSSTVPLAHARVSVPTIPRATSTRMTSWMFGSIVINSTATTVGCVATSVPTVATGATAKETVCICVMLRDD